MSCLRCQSVLGRFRNEAATIMNWTVSIFKSCSSRWLISDGGSSSQTVASDESRFESFVKVVVRLSHTMW